MILQCLNVNKSFNKTKVLKDINLSLEKSEIITILGKSGCGKSTLLRLILGLEKLDGGKIIIDEKIVATDKTQIEPNKRNLSMVFQDYALMPHLNVKKNILFSVEKMNKEDKENKLKHISKILEIDNLLDRYIHELSGGQQQRVAVARALISEPKIILFDEPFSNLDENLRQNLREELRNLIKKFNLGAIFVTHDKQDAFCISDKIALINNGKIEQIGTPKELYEKPKNIFVANFMGILNKFDCKDDKICAIRPEYCSINEDGKLKGEIISITYLGNYNNLKIKLENSDNIIEINTLHIKNLKVNDKISIKVNESKIINFDMDKNKIYN